VAGLGVSAALLRPLLAGGGCCLLARKGLEARVGAAEGRVFRPRQGRDPQGALNTVDF
jgi:hypothetical protein